MNWVDKGDVSDALMAEMQREIAPGSLMREALDRIQRGRTGALIVLRYDESVEAVSSGGFELDVELSPTRLRELCKMDGAVVVDYANKRIRRANVQLTPDASIPTTEAGMRHRTAQRTAIQTGHPVISVSQSMRTVALYVGSLRHVVEESATILGRGDLALSALERYRTRLDQVLNNLTNLEMEDVATVRDVTTAVQRLEMMARISREVESYTVQAGTDGRLLRLQHEELISGVMREHRNLVRDYVPTGATQSVMSALQDLTAPQLVDLSPIARAMQLAGGGEVNLDQPVSPRGYRLIARIPRLPASVVNAVVAHYANLQTILSAPPEELAQIEGVSRQRARALREGLSRIAESSLQERMG